jgi:hypothetical protein
MRNRFTLPDQSYDVGVTRVDRPLYPPQMDARLDSFRNRNRTSTLPFILVANAPSVRALPRNLRRTGLRLQNVDATGTLYYSIGNDLAVNGLQIPPGGSDLYDFTTPADELYLFATANIRVIIVEMSREMEAPVATRKK